MQAQQEAYTNLTHQGQKPKGRKNSTLNPEKGDFKHNKLKNEKAENIAQMKEETRNTQTK